MDDKAVNVAFGDKRQLLHPSRSKGVTFRYTLTVVNQCLARVGIPQRLGNIHAAEQVLAVLINDPDAAKLRVFENFHLVHITPPWAVQQKSGHYQPPACISWLTWAV